MKRTVIYILLILAIGSGCEQETKNKTVAVTPVNVRVESVNIREYKVPARVTGILGTTSQTKLSFKTGGIIRSIPAKEGASVARGTVLASLDLSEIRAQVSQANIGLEKSRRDLSRAKNLYEDSVATLETYQNARSSYELARTKKQIADFNLRHSTIKAPAEGTVQKVLVETNEMIGPGHPAILFASTEDEWVVRSALTDKDIVRLSIGDTGVVTMDAFPGIDFQAEVTELGSVADPVTGTYEAELMIISSRPEFRTGFMARAEIYPADSDQAVMVPLVSLQDATDRSAYVFIYSDGGVTRKLIRTGAIVGDRVVVNEGLKPGDQVVTEGARYLRTDSPVTLVSEPETLQP